MKVVVAHFTAKVSGVSAQEVKCV